MELKFYGVNFLVKGCHQNSSRRRVAKAEKLPIQSPCKPSIRVQNSLPRGVRRYVGDLKTTLWKSSPRYRNTTA